MGPYCHSASGNLQNSSRWPPFLESCPCRKETDIRNRELVVVKLVLEKRRHWIEGAAHHFTVFTDQKNTEYLCSAKRLNSCQAHWSLFFTRFNFTVSNRPGSKNMKADALSRLYPSKEKLGESETILPATCFVYLRQYTFTDSHGHTYVPSQLITWAHTAATTGHPGTQRTYNLLREKYRWIQMVTN